MTVTEVIFLVAGYVAGSVPFGMVLTRLAGYGDIRAIGSGNIGATNVMRTGNKPLALATLLCDALKGGAMVYIAQQFTVEAVAMWVGTLAVLGHIFPVWLRFKGGKGVATTLCVLLVMFWPVGGAACAVWLLVFALTRISSLSAIMAMAAVIPLAWLWLMPVAALSMSGIAVLVIARHHENIRRMWRGEELLFQKKN